MMARRDDATLELLTWEPPTLVPSFPAGALKAPTFRDRLALAVSLTLSESEIPRKEIAKRMAESMGEDMSIDMLNAYSSQARKEHTISANRLAALCAATGDMRAMQLLVDSMDSAIVPKKYVSAIEDAMLTDKLQELDARRRLARRRWKS
jgi:hypothetical protein